MWTDDIRDAAYGRRLEAIVPVEVSTPRRRGQAHTPERQRRGPRAGAPRAKPDDTQRGGLPRFPHPKCKQFRPRNIPFRRPPRAGRNAFSTRPARRGDAAAPRRLCARTPPSRYPFHRRRCAFRRPPCGPARLARGARFARLRPSRSSRDLRRRRPRGLDQRPQQHIEFAALVQGAPGRRRHRDRVELGMCRRRGGAGWTARRRPGRPAAPAPRAGVEAFVVEQR